MDYQLQITIVAEAFDERDTFYYKVAPIVAEIFNISGSKGVIEFAKDVEEQRGKKISARTLLSYSWMYRRTGNLPIPKELSLNTTQKIAAIKYDKVRAKFVNKINKEGLSDSDVRYLLKYR